MHIYPSQSNKISKEIFNIYPSENTFNHFKSKKGNIPLQERLQSIIKLYELIPNKSYIALPMKNSGQKSPNSQCFDFIIIKQKNSQICIYSFDITIQSQEINEYSDKVTKSRRVLKEIFQNYSGNNEENPNPKIKQWKHVILCRPQKFYRQLMQLKIDNRKDVKAQVQIFTSDLSKIQFQVSKTYINYDEAQKQTNFLQNIKASIFQQN